MAIVACSMANVNNLLEDIKKSKVMNTPKSELQVKNMVSYFNTVHIAEALGKNESLIPTVNELKNQETALRMFTLSNKNILSPIVSNTIKTLETKLTNGELSEEESYLYHNCILFNTLIHSFADYNSSHRKINDKFLVDVAVSDADIRQIKSLIKSPFVLNINKNLVNNLTVLFNDRLKSNVLYTTKYDSEGKEIINKGIESLTDKNLDMITTDNLSNVISIFNKVLLDKILNSMPNFNSLSEQLFIKTAAELKAEKLTKEDNYTNINTIISDLLTTKEVYLNEHLKSDLIDLNNNVLNYLKSVDIVNLKKQYSYEDKIKAPTSVEYELGGSINPKDKSRYIQALCSIFDNYVQNLSKVTGYTSTEVLNLYTPARIWSLTKSYITKLGLTKERFINSTNKAEKDAAHKCMLTTYSILYHFNYLVDNCNFLLANKYGYNIKLKMSIANITKDTLNEVDKELGNNLEDRADADDSIEESNYNSAYISEEIENFSHITTAVKQAISNISKRDITKKSKADDPAWIIGDVYECLDPIKVHSLLLEHLADMHTQQDLLPLLYNLSVAKPEFLPLYNEVSTNTTLQNAFYRDFSRNSRKMTEAVTDFKTGQIRFIAANGLNSYVINSRIQSDLADMTTLLNSPYNLFDVNGNLLLEDPQNTLYDTLTNIKTIIDSIRGESSSLLENINKSQDSDIPISRNSLASFFQTQSQYKKSENDYICLCRNLGLDINPVIIDNLMNLKYKSKLGFIEFNDNLNSMLSNIIKLLDKNKHYKELNPSNYNRFTLYENNKSNYTELSKLLSKVDDNAVDNMAKIKGKSYNSRSIPNYLNSVLEKLADTKLMKDPQNSNKNITYSEFYMNNHYKDCFWFYKNNRWRNPILSWITESKNADLHKNKLRTNTIQIYDGKEFKFWSEKDFYDIAVANYFSTLETTKETDPSSQFLAGTFSDNPSFIFYEAKVRNNDEGINCYIDIIKQELERMSITNSLTNKELKIDNFIKNKDKFCTFPELNIVKLEVKGNLPGTDEEEIPYNFTGTIKEQLQNVSNFTNEDNIYTSGTLKTLIYNTFADYLIKNHTEELIKKLTDVGTLQEVTNKGLRNYKFSKSIKTGTTEKSIVDEEELRSLAMNHTINNIGMTQLLDSNMAFYKTPLDFYKRCKQSISPKYSYGNKGDFVGDTIVQQKCIVAKDEIFTSNSIKEIDSVISRAAIEGKITKEEAKNIIDSYKDFKIADGQSFRSISSYVKLLKMEGNKNYEKFRDAAQRILKGKWTKEDYFLIYQCIKPFMVTQNKVKVDYTDEEGNNQSTTLLVPIQQKNSEVVLFMGMLIANNTATGSKLKAINDFMEKNDIDTFMFESCVKVGGMQKVDLSQFKNNNSYNDVYNYLQDTCINSAGVADPDIVNYIDINDFGMQTPTPPSIFDETMAIGIQVRKVIMRGLSDNLAIKLDNSNSVYNKSQIMNLYQQAICSNINTALNEFTELIKNPVELSNLLIDQLNSSDLYDPDLKLYCSLNTDENGNIDLTSPMYDPIQSHRIQSMLLSALRKRVLKQAFSGGDCIAMTNYGKTDELSIRFKDKNGNLILNKEEFAKKNRNISIDNLDKEFDKYEENAKQDSTFAYMEVYFPCYSKAMQDALLDKDSKGNEYLNIDKTNITGEKIFSEDLRYIIGYRTPTEDNYSIIPMKIKGFLPVCAGSSIMLPSEMEVSTGGDYDGDKFYMILNESTNTSTKNSKNIQLTEKASKQYEEDKKNNAKNTYKNDYISFQKIKYDHSKKMSENSIKAKANLVNEIQYKILTSKEQSYTCLKNGNFDTLKHDGFILDILNKLTIDDSLQTALNIEDNINEKINNFKEILNNSEGILDSADINYYRRDLENKKLDEVDYIKLVGKFINTLKGYNLNKLSALHDKLSSFSEPCTLSNLISMMEQNKSGKNMIEKVAVFNSLAANLNWTNAFLKNSIQVKYSGDTKLYEYSSLSNSMINGVSTFKILAEMQAASVDNAKAPVLGYFNLIGNNSGIAMLLAKLGIKPLAIGLFLNQPAIKTLTKIVNSEELQEELFKNSNKGSNRSINKIIDAVKDLYIKKINDDTVKITPVSKVLLDEDILNKGLFNGTSTEELRQQIDYLSMFSKLYNTSSLLTSLSISTRTDKDTPENFMEIINNRDAITDINKRLSAVSYNKGELPKYTCPILNKYIKNGIETISPLIFIKNEEVNFGQDLGVDNPFTFPKDERTGEEYPVPIPYLQAYYQSVNISFAKSIENYFPFLNENFINTVKEILNKNLDVPINPNIYDKTFYKKFITDFINFYVTNAECFDDFLSGNATNVSIEDSKNKVANRNKFIIQFPTYFKNMQKELINGSLKYPELSYLSFFKYFVVDTPTNNFSKNRNTKRSFPILDFKGNNITNKQTTQQFREDWRALLYSDKPELRNLAKQLFIYGFLVHGLNYNNKNILMFAPALIYNVLPGYKAAMSDIKTVFNNPQTSKEALSRFIFQYNINNPTVSFMNKSLVGQKFSQDIENIIDYNGNSALNEISNNFITSNTINNKTYYTLNINSLNSSDIDTISNAVTAKYIDSIQKAAEDTTEEVTIIPVSKEDTNIIATKVKEFLELLSNVKENPPLSYFKFSTTIDKQNGSYKKDYILYKESSDYNSIVYILPLQNSLSEYANNYNSHQDNIDYYISDTPLKSLTLDNNTEEFNTAIKEITEGSTHIKEFETNPLVVVPNHMDPSKGFKTSYYTGNPNQVINYFKGTSKVNEEHLKTFNLDSTDKLKLITLEDLSKVDFAKFFIQDTSRDVYIVTPENYTEAPDTFNTAFKTIYDNLFKTYLNGKKAAITLLKAKLVTTDANEDLKNTTIHSQAYRLIFPEFLSRAFRSYMLSKSDIALLDEANSDMLTKNNTADINNVEDIFNKDIEEVPSNNVNILKAEYEKLKEIKKFENSEDLISAIKDLNQCM